MEQIIYDRLKEVARVHELTNYTAMGALVGLGPRDSRLWGLLDEINQFECMHKRPMISALVINQEENRPGPGFWKCAAGLGKFILGDDEDRFWSAELRRVWEYWTSH